MKIDVTVLDYPSYVMEAVFTKAVYCDENCSINNQLKINFTDLSNSLFTGIRTNNNILFRMHTGEIVEYLYLYKDSQGYIFQPAT